MKYETPQLKYIGQAQVAVRGVVYVGGDAIGQWDYQIDEFARDN